MGYYFGNRQVPVNALEHTFTAREYCVMVERVGRQFLEHPLNDLQGEWPRQCQPVFDYFKTGNFAAAVRLLSEGLKNEPQNRHMHRVIGLAWLFQGRLHRAQGHLEFARRLLRREGGAGGSLQEALHIQLERALLRCTLLSLYRRLGCSHDARTLVEEEAQDL